VQEDALSWLVLWRTALAVSSLIVFAFLTYPQQLVGQVGLISGIVAYINAYLSAPLTELRIKRIRCVRINFSEENTPVYCIKLQVLKWHIP